jgi:hypothetical protein
MRLPLYVFFNVTSLSSLQNKVHFTSWTSIMRKEEKTDEVEEPLVDTTAPIPLRSKRTERQQKKRHLREKAHKQQATLWDLPLELIHDILALLCPSDVFRLSRVNKPLRQFIHEEEDVVVRGFINRRYAALSKCFPAPVLLEKVDAKAHPAQR